MKDQAPPISIISVWQGLPHLRGCMVCVAGTESVGNKYINDFVEVEETFLINMIQIK